MSGVVESSEAGRELLLSASGGIEAVRSWFNWRTFKVEERAEAAVAEYGDILSQQITRLRTDGATDEQLVEWQAGYVKRWLAYQRAGSRTMNWMITGPARFPVERNNKRMEVERKRGDELFAYTEARSSWLRRRTNSAERATKSEAAKSVAHEFKEMAIDGIRLVHNTVLDRVQLVFEGKPEPEVIADLKRRAFRWSPREGAWQRQLTRNGIWAAQGLLAIIEQRRITGLEG